MEYKVTPVRNLEDLGPGNHIRIVRGITPSTPKGIYDHHMLVIEVKDKKTVHVIHYTGDMQSVFSQLFGLDEQVPAIVEADVEFDLKTDRLELLTYSEEILPTDKAIAKARSREGEKDYGLFGNNCESFVNWVLTGKAITNQADAGLDQVQAGFVEGASKGYLEGGLKGLFVEGFKSAAGAYANYREERN